MLDWRVGEILMSNRCREESEPYEDGHRFIRGGQRWKTEKTAHYEAAQLAAEQMKQTPGIR